MPKPFQKLVIQAMYTALHGQIIPLPHERSVHGHSLGLEPVHLLPPTMPKGSREVESQEFAAQTHCLNLQCRGKLKGNPGWFGHPERG
jgi:hypothetical protein